MKKNDILTDVTVEKLILGGSGLATHSSGKRIIISGGAIPGSRVDIRVVKTRANRIEGQILRVTQRSPLERDLPAHFQVYGGCRWLPIPYDEQLRIKEQQIREVFHHVPDLIAGAEWHPIHASPEVYGYRNKVEFSWGKYISGREGIHDEYRFGFHAAGQFDRIVDCTFCALGDDTTNQLYTIFDDFARESRLPTYDTKTYEGFWRHLVIRRSRKHHTTMVILSVNSAFLGGSEDVAMGQFRTALEGLIRICGEKQLIIDAFYLLHNSGRADIVQGEYELIHGVPTITETVCGRDFEISPRSFFQTNSLGAEVLYRATQALIQSQEPTIFDLYAGTGTIGMIMAEKAQKVYSVEIVAAASADNIRNLEKNHITNVEVINAPVETFLESWKKEYNTHPDVIIIDPPRSGMHPDAPHIIRDFGPREIIYVSCNPATLVRDLSLMCEDGAYSITDIIPVDMFPHTHHIETIVRLEKK